MVGGLALSSAVTVATRDVRVADLVPASAGPVAELVVLRLPPRAAQTRLPAAAIATLLKRRVPGLPVDSVKGDVVITRRREVARSRGAGCLVANRNMAAGEAVSRADADPAPCEGSASAALVYDRRNGATVVREDLAAGTYLGRASLADAAMVRAGTSLTLRSTAGPVVIERAVTTLQPARAGGRVFVRDGNGAILSVPLVLEAAR